MANAAPEQELITQFMEALELHADSELRPKSVHNANCRSRIFADIEYEFHSGLRWVIEAKSDVSKDRYNTVHKIFGELLKETGRTNRKECRQAILIPTASIPFYGRLFQCIAKDKFVKF